MAIITSVVPMDNVVIIHLYASNNLDRTDPQALRKRATEVYNEKLGFMPDKGMNWSAKEWKQYDSFISWLTEAWEQNEKDYYPSNGAFVALNRKTGESTVFLLDCSTYRDPSYLAGMHLYYEIS